MGEEDGQLRWRNRYLRTSVSRSAGRLTEMGESSAQEDLSGHAKQPWALPPRNTHTTTIWAAGNLPPRRARGAHTRARGAPRPSTATHAGLRRGASGGRSRRPAPPRRGRPRQSATRRRRRICTQAGAVPAGRARGACQRGRRGAPRAPEERAKQTANAIAADAPRQSIAMIRGLHERSPSSLSRRMASAPATRPIPRSPARPGNGAGA